MAEVGLIGREGVAGASLVLGVNSSFVEAYVQAEGEGLQMEAGEFQRELEQQPDMRKLLFRYHEALNAQAMQTAACNGRHELEQRLARGLLMAHDRAENDVLPLTQEFLALMNDIWWISPSSPSRYTVHAPNRVKAMTAILVAEEDPRICDLLTDALEADLSATVRCERTGSLALRAIETAGFDLLIIDVDLPEISGYELARRAANRNIPALLSSGHPDAVAKLVEYEFPYLAKPYHTADLIGEAAVVITQAGKNIRRIKASFAKLEATIEGLKADVVDEWLSRLAP